MQIMLWSKEYEALAPERFLLGRNEVPTRYKGAVATQLRLSKQLAVKLPIWADAAVYIPEGINLEQASSQTTALHKRYYIRPDEVLLDMTGGLGVDFWAMASYARRGVYVEQSSSLIEAACYNLAKLLLNNSITMLQADSTSALTEIIREHSPSLIYIDPARREGILGQKRVYAIEDCSPNLYDVVEEVRRVCTCGSIRILAKLSPMLDIKHTIDSLPSIMSIEIVAVKGEVKELLLLIEPCISPQSPLQVPIRAVDLDTHEERSRFEGTYEEEQRTNSTLADEPERYIYEPNGAVMKSGLFRSIGKRYHLKKLHQHTHLYTSCELVESFPGRAFELEQVVPFTSSNVKKLSRQVPRCMLSVRNFPMDAEALRRKLGVKDGGDLMLIGTTLADESRVLLLCRPLNLY